MTQGLKEQVLCSILSDLLPYLQARTRLTNAIAGSSVPVMRKLYKLVGCVSVSVCYLTPDDAL